MIGLKISNVAKHFGSFVALKRIDLEIASGEFVVLVGPSGCGKSTLLGIIAGLEKQSSGEIEIACRPVTNLPARDRDIAMVFQSYALYPSMTVRQNVTFGMKCRGIPRSEQRLSVARVASLLQLDPLLDRRPSQLSGGQRQRVAIGRALVRDPALFLFDEPLSNLDAKLRVQMRMEIKQLHQQIGKTTVYVTHDQVEAMTLASRVAVMNRGEVQQFDKPKRVYDHPANLFVAQFMGSPPMNTIPARLENNSGQIWVRIGFGRADNAAFQLPNVSESLGPWIDRDVILGIRPECIVELAGAEISNVPMTKISGRVVMSEATGTETIGVIDVAGQRLLCRLDPELSTSPGAECTFRLDTRKVCIFDPTTEKLINSPL
jgi:multiple sugar transport system ATP-binding protein